MMLQMSDGAVSSHGDKWPSVIMSGQSGTGDGGFVEPVQLNQWGFNSSQVAHNKANGAVS